MIILINNNKIKILKKKYTNYTIKYIQTDTICLSANNILIDNNLKQNINSSIYFINIKNSRSINIIRHSCSHLLAHAISKIYNDTKFSTGPVIKNGFYYDFETKEKIKDTDLEKIEKKMNELSKEKITIEKKIINIKNAKTLFKNNKYKQHIISKIKKNNITIYKQNEFIDLCKGPHLKNTQTIKYFKLLKISGAYWNENKNNEMIYRIYGTAWKTKDELNTYIKTIAKTHINDHKKIGQILNLFIFDKNSQGVVFWNKNGWKIYSDMINYIRNIIKKDKYKEVNTPIMLEKTLYEKSGHLEKFSKHMFKYKTETTLNILKPMNCPCHANIFNNFYKKSYKDLPVKISEFGSCFRNELSGSLHGLMRLKNFVQDDGHIFCSENQIMSEILTFIKMLKRIYYFFGFKLYKIVLSKKPDNIKNNLKKWFKAEYLLEKSLILSKLKYALSTDGAFYGPKIEFSLKDNFNRIWQCGTIQIDFFTSKKLNIVYSDKNSKLKNPIILHRAILGSIERFIGILLENKNGNIPFILTPTQFEIIYINENYLNYAKKIYTYIKNKYKTKLTISKERLEYKIKKCILEKIKYIIIIGEREYTSNTITIRKKNKIKNMSINNFISKIKLDEF
ncbi:MAG TPA: threonine--tRNA ligase [Candidatus Azoamicus sp. MARI]